MSDLNFMKMKPYGNIFLVGISLFTLASCASVSDVYDDNVYATRGTYIPVGESIDDETSYSSYKYQKDQLNSRPSSTYYDNEINAPFRRNVYFMVGYNPYNPYGFYDPFYDPFYRPYGRPVNNWGYIPGYGWSYVGYYPYTTFGYSSYYGGYPPYYGYSPYYGHGGYYGGGYYGGGYGSGYYGGFGYGGPMYGGYYNMGWNYGWSGNNYHNTNPGNVYSNYHSGPRGGVGGGNVVTRGNTPGVVKSSPAPATGVMRTDNTRPSAVSGQLRPVDNSNISTRTPVTRATRENTAREVKPSINAPVRIDNNVIRNRNENVNTTAPATIDNNTRPVTTPVRTTPVTRERSANPNSVIMPSRTNENVPSGTIISSPERREIQNNRVSPSQQNTPSRIERPVNQNYGQPTRERNINTSPAPAPRTMESRGSTFNSGGGNSGGTIRGGSSSGSSGGSRSGGSGGSVSGPRR